MDHSHHGTGSNLFQPTNMFISRLFWYFVVSAVFVGFIGQVWQKVDNWLRLKAARNGWNGRHPSIPTNFMTQLYATTRTVFREVAYPQGYYISKRGFQWLSPPPVGKSLIVLSYWVIITVMLTSNSILPFSDPYYFEKIGFRAAWVTVTQVPLAILLANKINLVAILIGSSYERLNWLHRWVSRTMLVTLAVHAGFFLRQWIRADFLAIQLEIMPTILYGMGAAGILLFMNLVGLAPLRHQFYELFVITHLASIGAFLWCIYKHVPKYAMWHIWLAIGFIAFDRGLRLLWVMYRNIRLRSKTNLAIADRVGYRTELHALPGNTTRVVLKNIPWNWTPGQHIYIWIPRMGFIETHPFTISNISADSNALLSDSDAGSLKSSGRHAQLEIRAHGGFSKRLYNLASKHSSKPLEVRSFIQGPFGTHPTWNTFETLVLVSASTGGSFTIPILESIIADPGCVQKCHFILIVRERSQCSCYLHRLRNIARAQKHKNLHVTVHVAVTGTSIDDNKLEGAAANVCCCGKDKPGVGCVCGSEEIAEHKRVSIASDSSDDQSRERAVQGSCCAPPIEEAAVVETEPMTKDDASTEKKAASLTYSEASISLGQSNDVNFLSKRPLLSNTIREAVEAAQGEICVVVCGGKPLSGHVRNVVTRLSDERAVHKGTGAQGIALWVEEFGL